MKSVLKTYWNSYTPKGQFWLSLGILMLAVDAALAAAYGLTQTTLHGIGFALVAIMFALLPDAAREEWEEGRKLSASVLGLLCVPIGIVAYYSHIGYGAGVRLGDMQKATFQNAVASDTRDSVADARAQLAMFTKRLADLEARNAWLPTVTADGLRAEIDAKNEAIRQEERRGGCGPRCLGLKTELATLEARRSAAEERKDLSSQIAATRAVVDNAREKAANTKQANSSVVNQNHVGAQLWLTMNGLDPAKAIHPDEVTSTYVNIMVAGFGALAFLLLAPISIYKAGRCRKLTAATLASKPATVENVSRETSNVSQPANVVLVQPKQDAESLASWADLHRVLNHLTEPKRLAA